MENVLVVVAGVAAALVLHAPVVLELPDRPCGWEAVETYRPARGRWNFGVAGWPRCP